MSDITKIDKNFAVPTEIKKEGWKFYSVEEEPFQIYGVFKENGKYRRMPQAVAESVNDGVAYLHADTTGGRVRFVTDSSRVAIHAKTDRICRLPHFALTGTSGYDIYADGEYVRTFVPPYDMQDGFESTMEFYDEKRMREITLNLPLYASVCELYIGLEDGAILSAPTPYKNVKPVVYYGSSITQGGCASRPGMSYQAIVSRELNLDFWNLGFSGSARAEDEMVDYIKDLDMSVFVLDYDHNAPNLEHLKNTHEKMFLAIRDAHPDLPVIMMVRPNHILSPDEEERKKVIEATYQNALNRGDKNVYYIDNEALTALCKDNGLVDRTHPTDYGFASMADAVCKVLKNIEVV